MIAENSVSENHSDHKIVCIGASAGGMEAIHELFDNIPHNSGFSFIVIQHLSSDHKSLMGELLSKHTTMDVIEAADRTAVAPDSVYVIPNNRNITIHNRKLLLRKKEGKDSPNKAIDIFLDSLAKDVGEKAIAVILSGTGTDGTKGITEIKKAGGLVFVQDPSTAKFDGMPHSAIASGRIDFILSPESIAEELLTNYKTPLSGVIVDALPSEDEPILQEIFTNIQSVTSCDFRFYKRPTLIRRLTKRSAFLNYKSLIEYSKFLLQNKEEAELLCREFLVGVTKFFRDPHAFEELKLKVIPEIVSSKRKTDTIKIWSAACSTGEEVYSIAILIREHFNRLKTDLDVKIFATDVNKQSVDFASRGCYLEPAVKDIPKELLEKYFIKEGSYFRVVSHLRKMIVFSQHDLLKDPPFGKLDLVACRNMLIYVSPQLQSRIMSVFHFSLNLGGYLFLGPSEHIGSIKESMTEISKKWKIYKNHNQAKSIGVDAGLFADSVTRKLSPSTASKDFSGKGIVENILTKVLEEYNLAGALVNQDCNIIETFGAYRKYLHLPEKKFDLNLLRMLSGRASIVLSAPFRKVVSLNERQIVRNVWTNAESMSITVTMLPSGNPVSKSVIILFSEEVTTISNISEPKDGYQNAHAPDMDDLVILQNELRDTKEILQKSIEDAETTNEELQSSNEELISANEELQSANEELQSLNEELHTVNAENQLRIKEVSELNDDLNNYFASSEIAQILLDKSFLIRKYTLAATQLVSLIESDIGRPITDLSTKIGYDGLMSDLKHVLNTGQAVTKTIAVNENVWYQMKALPFLREEKIIDGVVLVFIDISEMKAAEKLINEANDELKMLNANLIRTNKELEQFAYITSHDLQEPLRKIQTFADLTGKNLEDIDSSRKYLDKISKAAVRMSSLINDVLSYSRLTSADEKFVDLDLNEIVSSVIEDFELMIDECKASIKVPKFLPLKGIPMQLHQLFANLLGNSLKFCDGEPLIKIECVMAEKDEIESRALDTKLNYVKIIFTDNGIGFDQKYADKVFTIFQRLNHKKLYAGTGIGLALCKRIVENHQGAIFVSSKVNSGSVFTIYLPA